MKTKLDIRDIQFLNLFEQITRVKAKCCFNYGSFVFFIVEKDRIERVKPHLYKLGFQLKRQVRVLPMPRGLHDLNFFLKVISQNKIKRVEIRDNSITIYSMPRMKAMLIGKNKTKLIELCEILENFFDIKDVMIK